MRLERLRRPADRDPHPALLDRHLPQAGLLDDPDDLPDSFRPSLVDAAGAEAVVTARPAPDRLEQRLGLVAEEREQEQLLLARGQPCGFFTDAFEEARGTAPSVARGRIRERLEGFGIKSTPALEARLFLWPPLP